MSSLPTHSHDFVSFDCPRNSLGKAPPTETNRSLVIHKGPTWAICRRTDDGQWPGQAQWTFTNESPNFWAFTALISPFSWDSQELAAREPFDFGSAESAVWCCNFPPNYNDCDEQPRVQMHLQLARLSADWQAEVSLWVTSCAHWPVATLSDQRAL